MNAGIDLEEIALVERLLEAYAKRYPHTKFSALQPLPLEKPPEISLSDDLQQLYEISSEKIVVNTFSDVLGEMNLRWITDPITKENLQVLLVEDAGIRGRVTFSLEEDMEPQEIPVHIQLADPETFGRIPWERTSKWRNQTPYPVRLKRLHILMIKSNEPIIYSWDLQDTEVSPHVEVKWKMTRFPSWLEREAERIWVEYAVVQQCESCDDQVIADITGGVTSFGTSFVTFHTMNPFELLGTYEMSVKVRS
ncbi:MAG: hypothetical protein GKR87_00780 [Kiritimatiellae bacterium]|nr:hypothetical protein [Kiritimatiellia bacterium]